MRKLPLFLFLLFTSFFSYSQTLVHYWNFNNSADSTSQLTPTLSLINGSSAIHNSGGNSGSFFSIIQIISNTGQGFDVFNLNNRNSDPAETHLRLNNPIGGKLIFSMPTTGYNNIVVKYVTRRSGSGAHNQVIDYSTNGTDFINLTTIQPADGNPTLQTLDFSGISGANNNPNFKVRIGFTQGGGGLEGNNRFDNFTLEGNPLPTEALIHYWNFNDNSTAEKLLMPTVGLIAGASIIPQVSGTTVIDLNGTGQDFDVANANGRNGDAASTHLRYNLPIPGSIICNLPTTNATDIIVKYVTRRSGSGAGTQKVAISTDGINFSPLTDIIVTETPVLQTFDFTANTNVNNNPNFKLRIIFEVGTAGTGGNNRFDNFTVDGKIVLTDNQPPVVLFNPADGSTVLPVNTAPTLTFNRDIRLLDNSAINNTNVDAVVELRLDNAAGTPVAFAATYNNRVITITPSSVLANSQTYYVALKANVIEATNDVAINAIQSASFTTIALQTVLNAGDLLPVAYRMNTSDLDDEIAFVSFVNIMPGTIVNFTDNKFTSNAQTQCAGGFTFTSPASGIAAGSVFRIVTSPLSSGKGIVGGSGFGLSSGGDQVIVYTGTAVSPSYVTAFSSNMWVANNISCSGSLSMIPAGLVDGTTSLNMSTHPNAVSGNVVNAYYNGPQEGSVASLKLAILDLNNWVAAGSGTIGQIWPNWVFNGPPSVGTVQVVNGTTLRVIFNKNMMPASAQNIANYTGIANLTSAVATANGSLPDSVLLSFSTAFVSGTPYVLTVSGVMDANGTPMAAPFEFSFTYNTSIRFDKEFVVVKEDAGMLSFQLNLQNPSTSSVNLVLKTAPWSTADVSDIGFTSTVLNFDAASNAVQNIQIPINDDVLNELDEYFVLSLESGTGLSVTGSQFATIYIKDNDRKAPEKTKELELEFLSSFKVNNPAGSTAEVVVYDAVSKKLMITSGTQNRLDVADFSNPALVTTAFSIDITPYGKTITSVATKNGIIACAVPNNDDFTNGSVVFFDIDGNFLKQLTVGVLPDMITFSPDGLKVMTANEGQPNDAYTIDPEGTISIIDVSGGIAPLTQANVTTLDFTAFNGQEAILAASGVRKTKSTSTLSQDFEPEYITISPDSKKAWVTLQENNAIAEIDLMTNTIIKISGLGTKDFSVANTGADISDNNGEILIANWPLKSFFMPDAIGNYTVGGKTYLVTANEGDEKESTGLNERTTVGAGSTVLDPVVFPNAEVLKKSYNMGRLRITNLNGNTDADPEFEELFTVGARSFSIWDAETGALVYDSKDEIELVTSQDPVFGSIFNADHENNNLKGRSRSKGPEPEGVALANINGKQYAFIALERIGGILVYNITDPTDAKLVDYKNNRLVNAYGGDHGPETLVYISNETSPDGKAYVVVTNEVSGNITIFEVKGAITTPVTLLTYDARLQNNGSVLLKWTTSTETNSSHFSIERSSDGRNFEKIGQVEAKGLSVSNQNYQYVDVKPGTGKVFYKLEQVDKDGLTTQKGIRAVDIRKGALPIWVVAPNPVRANNLQITTENIYGKVQVKLMDTQGKILYSQAIEARDGTIRLPTARPLAPGLYYLYVEGYGTKPVTVL